jgi:membrane protease YdiL (CAAX protease family)
VIKKIISITLSYLFLIQSSAIASSNEYKLDISFKSTINPLISNQEVIKESLEKEVINTPQDINPIAAGWIATVFPGAGYYYIGEYNKALLSAPLIFPLVLPKYITTDTYTTKGIKVQSLYVSNFLTDFTVYDTYQTALDKLNRPKQVLSIPHYSFHELYLAPFDSRAYISEHWQSNLFRFGILGLSTLVSGLNIKQKGINKNLTPQKAAVTIPLILAFAFLVGFGEELYFRGFVQPSISELSNSKLIGNIAQATNFGIAHTQLFSNIGLTSYPYGISTITTLTAPSFIDKKREFYLPASPSDGSNNNDLTNFARTFILGFALGATLEADENNHGLLKTIAFHSLFDSILMTSDFLTEGHTGRLYLQTNLPIHF